jgi:hypothetical protein
VELGASTSVEARVARKQGMLLRRPVSQRLRAAIFVAVVGLHFLAGLLIVATERIRIARLSIVDSPLSLLSLSQEIPPKLLAASPASMPTRNLRRPESSRDTEGLHREAPELNNAITLALDSSTDAATAARRQSDKEESEGRRRNLAGPSESQLEWWRNSRPLALDHQLGDTERAEGGEIITWVNDKCFYTTHGIATFGVPQTTQVCKDPPKPETELFKDMRKQLDGRTQGRAP